MFRLSTLVLLMSSIVAVADTTDLYTVPLPVVPDPTVVNGYAAFTLGVNGAPGQPALPTSALRIVMAPDADMGSVTLTVQDTVSKLFPGDYQVQAVPKNIPCGCIIHDSMPVSAARAAGVVPVGGDSVVYQTNAWFPTARFPFLRGALGPYKLVDITFSPFVYNPVTLKLRKIESGRIRVNFNRIPELAGAVFGRNEQYEEFLRGRFENDTAVLALYGGSPTANATAFPLGTRHFEMMLPAQAGEIQLPFAQPGSRYQVSVRGLDGKVRFAGQVQGNKIRIEGNHGLKLHFVKADRIE